MYTLVLHILLCNEARRDMCFNVLFKCFQSSGAGGLVTGQISLPYNLERRRCADANIYIYIYIYIYTYIYIYRERDIQCVYIHIYI